MLCQWLVMTKVRLQGDGSPSAERLKDSAIGCLTSSPIAVTLYKIIHLSEELKFHTNFTCLSIAVLCLLISTFHLFLLRILLKKE